MTQAGGETAAIADLAWLSYVSFPRFPRSRPEGTINIITSQTESQTPAAGGVPVTGAGNDV